MPAIIRTTANSRLCMKELFIDQELVFLSLATKLNLWNLIEYTIDNITKYPVYAPKILSLLDACYTIRGSAKRPLVTIVALSRFIRRRINVCKDKIELDGAFLKLLREIVGPGMALEVILQLGPPLTVPQEVNVLLTNGIAHDSLSVVPPVIQQTWDQDIPARALLDLAGSVGTEQGRVTKRHRVD